jgi:hypothetical protein
VFHLHGVSPPTKQTKQTKQEGGIALGMAIGRECSYIVARPRVVNYLS